MRAYLQSRRFTLSLALVGAALGLAPTAGAQQLALTVGAPISYRVSLPQAWARHQDEEVLFVVSDDEEFVIMTAAVDLLAGEKEPLPLPEAEMRRLMTTMMMNSDSLLVDLLGQVFLNQSEYPVSELVQEVGTLGGERAAHLSGRMQIDGVDGRFQLHVTMKDGVMYMLGFLSKGEFPPARRPLMAQIRESFILADSPPPLASRPRRGVPRRTSRS